MSRTELIKDEIFEQTQTRRLEECRKVIQTALNEWNKLNFSELKSAADLYEMLFAPEVVYGEATRQLLHQAEQLGTLEEFQKTKQPYPQSFYSACEFARRNPYSSRSLNLFTLDRGRVKLNGTSSEVVKAHSVFANNPNQVTFFEELKGLLDLLNKLNRRTNGHVLNNGQLGHAFSLPLRAGEGEVYDIRFNSEGLRELLKRVR